MGNSIVSIQNALSAGELSPSIWGRSDVAKYHSGTTTCRNFFANYKGGVSSRAGLAYVGTCKETGSLPPRDIPFQFSLTQGYALEFGNLYMRIKTGGAYVLEDSFTVTGVTSNGTVTTSAPSGYVGGDWVYIQGTGTSLDNLTWIIHNVTSTTSFRLYDLFGNAVSTSTGSTGTVSRIYTVISPYAVADLPYLKYTQSADVMTLTCVNTETSTEYPPYSLNRLGNNNWTFTADTFAATIAFPTGLTITAQSSDIASTWYSYVITAVDKDSGEESVASDAAYVQNNDIALSAGSNTLTWTAVANAGSYNIYAATPSYSATVPVSSLYGFAGTSLGPSFTDTNITPDFTKVPPTHTNPFARGKITGVTVTAGGSNYAQTTIGYSITTGTGSGFRGTPVVDNGSFAGFIIENAGEGYLMGDTVTLTDSGGGLAHGTATFTSNPGDTNIMVLNGIEIAFTTTPHYPSDVGKPYIYCRVERTAALTMATLANTLAASNILSLSVATYTPNGSSMTITYKTPGTAGNAYTMGTLGAPVTYSGGTLTNGGSTGSGATGDLIIGEQTGTYPSVAAYFQQRRVYAASLNQPDTYWMSKPGLFNNMDSSIPVIASDSITGSPWAQQVNGIQFLVPMPGGLVVLTGKGAWQINGGSSAAITPSNQTATPQAYNGCNAFLPPHTVNYDILYVQAKGSIWRDLSYNFFTNIYTGTDITVLSNHLFTDFSMVQSCYAEEPYKLVWVIRNDGTLLCLTYLKEQDVYAWTRHDTNGFFVSICSVTEPPVDAVYVIIKRYIQGAWRYYSERMDDRIWNNVEDAYCVDSGLSYPETFPDATLTASGSTGTVTFTASSSVFNGGMVGDVIRVDNGRATITVFNSTTSVTALVDIDLTNVVPNDSNNLPVPAISGTWSISTLTSTVTGLNHLEGLTVTGLADGSVVPLSTVVDGQISLANPASKINIGLPYTCQVQTIFLDAGQGPETVQNRRKNISAVGARVEQSRGLQVGADQPDSSAQQYYAPVTWSDMTEIKERTNLVHAGVGIPLYTGDFYQAINSGWGLKGQVAFQQVYPLPANILSVISYWMIGDEK